MFAGTYLGGAPYGSILVGTAPTFGRPSGLPGIATASKPLP